MNILTLFFLLASANGFMMAVVLLFSKKKANLFMGGLVAVLSMALLNNAILPSLIARPFPFPIWLFYTVLLIPPFLYLYVLFTVYPNRHWENKYWLLFLPALIFQLISISAHIFYIFFGLRILPNITFVYMNRIEEPLAILGMILVMRKVSFLIKIHQAKIKNCYSNLQNIRLHWLQRLMILFLGACLVWIVIVPLEKFSDGQFMFPDFAYDFLWFIGSFIIFAIGYQAYRMPEVFRQEDFIENANKSKPIPFSQHNNDHALRKLKDAMEKDRKYRIAKLDIKGLAADIGLPVRYVSHLINHQLNTNFHDYVNSYRVEEVIRKIRAAEYQHFSLLAIALEAGFNSKSAFNYVFKKHTGQTPSAYKRSLQKEEQLNLGSLDEG